MNANERHLRGDVLRQVISTLDRRHDGLLPMDVRGVAETFRDEETLVGALQLRWYTRLSGHIEALMATEPTDLAATVVEAWVAAAQELPGVREALDHHTAHPTTPQMGVALDKASSKERQMMAIMAGLASDGGAPAAQVGAALEERARTAYAASPVRPTEPRGTHTLVDRLKAVLAA